MKRLSVYEQPSFLIYANVLGTEKIIKLQFFQLPRSMLYKTLRVGSSQTTTSFPNTTVHLFHFLVLYNMKHLGDIEKSATTYTVVRKTEYIPYIFYTANNK